MCFAGVDIDAHHSFLQVLREILTPVFCTCWDRYAHVCVLQVLIEMLISVLQMLRGVLTSVLCRWWQNYLPLFCRCWGPELYVTYRPPRGVGGLGERRPHLRQQLHQGLWHPHVWRIHAHLLHWERHYLHHGVCPFTAGGSKGTKGRGVCVGGWGVEGDGVEEGWGVKGQGRGAGMAMVKSKLFFFFAL